MRAPVDNPLPAIDEPFLIQPDKNLPYRPGTAFVQRVKRSRSQSQEQPSFLSCSTILPPYCAFQAQARSGTHRGRYPPWSGLPAFIAFHNFRFRRDRGMVCPRQPKRNVSLHPTPPDQDILQRFIHRMPHMKLPGNIWRGGSRWYKVFSPDPLCVKISAGKPKIVNSVLHFTRFICLCQFMVHTDFLHIRHKKSPDVSVLRYIRDEPHRSAVPPAFPASSAGRFPAHQAGIASNGAIRSALLFVQAAGSRTTYPRKNKPTASTTRRLSRRLLSGFSLSQPFHINNYTYYMMAFCRLSSLFVESILCLEASGKF